MSRGLIPPAALLAFESKTWRYSGAKERAIGETFGVTAIEYLRQLLDVLEHPPADLAVQFGPLINRRRRQLAKARAARSPRVA